MFFVVLDCLKIARLLLLQIYVKSCILLLAKLLYIYKQMPLVKPSEGRAGSSIWSKVYERFGTEPMVLWDFNLCVGDKANDYGIVTSVDYIDVDNVKYKRITISYDRYDYQSYLVEGIGMSSNKYDAYEQTSFYDVLVSVYQDGKCVFKDSDFAKQPTGIDIKNSRSIS